MHYKTRRNEQNEERYISTVVKIQKSKPPLYENAEMRCSARRASIDR